MDFITLPFSWLLLTFYEFVGNYGVSIILFGLVVKLILLPFQMKSKRSTMRTARLNPLMKELEKKHEGNKQKYQEAVAKLYKEEKINPMSGCLWSLLPLAILIPLYSVIREPFSTLMRLPAEAVSTIETRLVQLGHTLPEATDAYREISMSNMVHSDFSAFSDIPGLVDLDFSFLGINLGVNPDPLFMFNTDFTNPEIWLPAMGLFLVPIISALLSYMAMKISMKTNPGAGTQQQQGTMKGMMLMMPLMSLYIGFIMPAALGLYWITNSLFGMIQDFFLNRHFGKILDIEDAERRERMQKIEDELDKKRIETERKRLLGETERNKNTSKRKLQVANKTQEDERLAVERAAEKTARRAEMGITDEISASQVGKRRFARGRAYVDDRFENPEDAEDATKVAAELSEIDEELDKEFSAEVETEEEVEVVADENIEAEAENSTEDKQ